MSEEMINENSDIENNSSEGKSREEIEKEFFAKIAEGRKDDPLIGVKLGSDDIFKSLMKIARDDKNVVNVHDVTLYAAGLAGYACQASCMEKYIVREKLQFNDKFHLIMTARGEKYIFADCINEKLFTDKHSVWNLVSGMYKKMYPSLKVPSPAPFIKKVAESVGDPNYMVCREQTPEALTEMIALVWKNIYVKMKKYCPNSEEWPTLYAMVLQKCLVATKGMIDPKIAMNLIAEIAVFSSKIYIGDFGQ